MRWRLRIMMAMAMGILLLLCTERAALAKAPLVIEVIAEEHREENAERQMNMTQKPRVLIYHTHTWEAYEMTEGTRYTPTETWRTRDDAYNMIRIGEELTQELLSKSTLYSYISQLDFLNVKQMITQLIG